MRWIAWMLVGCGVSAAPTRAPPPPPGADVVAMSLRVEGAALIGQPLVFTVDGGPAGDALALAAGGLAAPGRGIAPWPQRPDVQLDLARGARVMGRAVVDGDGRATFSVAVPADPSLVGRTFCFQSAGASSTAWFLSGSSCVLIDVDANGDGLGDLDPCATDYRVDDDTLCFDHVAWSCEQRTVGMRRGEEVCLPAHALGGPAPVWATRPFVRDPAFRHTADGVIFGPETVFVSPIDAGWSPSRSTVVTSCAAAQTALQAAAPGEEIVLADGAYAGCVIRFYRSGSPGQPVRLRGEHPGGAVLDAGSVYMRGAWLVTADLGFVGTMPDRTTVTLGDATQGCDHCALRNVRMDGLVPAAPLRRAYVQVRGQDVEVSDSTFTGKANEVALIAVDPFQAGDPIRARIYRNHFADRTRALGPPGVVNGFEVIRIGSSASDVEDGASVIEGNLFERCDGELEIISIKSGANAVRFNTVRDSAGQITIRSGVGNIVEGNYVLGEGKADSGGVRVVGAHTLVLNNHLQDLDPTGGDYLVPIAVVTGTADHVAGYRPTFESVIAFNRVVSPSRALSLNAVGSRPADHVDLAVNNLVSSNLLYTEGLLPVLEDTTGTPLLLDNVIEDAWTDVEVGLDGFVLHADPIVVAGELRAVPGFDAAVAGRAVGDLVDGTRSAWVGAGVVLTGTDLGGRVPLLAPGDVGASW